MDEVRKRLERVDRNHVPILIRGGNGSGKEVLVRIVNKRYPGEMTPFCMVALDGEEGRRSSAILASQGDYSDPEVRYLDALPENYFSVGSLYMPLLRERREDNPGLAYYFWECCRKEFTSDARAPSPKMIAEFQEYSWLGNVRELANLMKCYALFSSEENIVHELDGRVHQSPTDGPPSDRAIPLKSLARQEVQSVGRKIILRTLRATRWNCRQTAPQESAAEYFFTKSRRLASLLNGWTRSGRHNIENQPQVSRKQD